MNRRSENHTPPGKKLHLPRAFTLLELVVVVAIMGIILMMGTLALKAALRRDPMTQAVVDFTTACQGSMGHPGARSLAILRGQTMELRIYPQERRIEVDAVNSGNGAAATAPADSGEPAADGTPAPKPAAGTPFSAQISDRVSFHLLEVNFTDCRNADYTTVRFYPNGTSDEFTVILLSDDGEARQITLDSVTALPQVTNPR
jgi:prepilin-type N-terminal cleavage/methylation domain-containing protein